MNLAHAAIMAEVPVDFGYLFRLEDANERVFVATVVERVQDTRRAIAREERSQAELAQKGKRA